MTNTTIVNAVQAVYSECDQQVTHIKKTCSKGCSFCCRQAITVFPIEELVIVNYLKQITSKRLINDLKKKNKMWLTEFKKITDKYLYPEFNKIHEDIDVLVKNNQFPSCPFLNEKQICVIYEARPLICRTFFVEENQQYCVDDPKRDASYHSQTAKLYGFKKMMEIDKTRALRFLPYATAAFFGIKQLPAIISVQLPNLP